MDKNDTMGAMDRMDKKENKSMLTSKQRANLRGQASKLEPIFQIGKEGVTEMQLTGLAEALSTRELIKISVLRSSDRTAKELIGDLERRLRAEAVAAIGGKIILYKRSSKDIKHIEF